MPLAARLWATDEQAARLELSERRDDLGAADVGRAAERAEARPGLALLVREAGGGGENHQGLQGVERALGREHGAQPSERVEAFIGHLASVLSARATRRPRDRTEVRRPP